MTRYEIFGREEKAVKKFDKKGCCYLGKVVSYPVGRYEEVGAVYLDLTSPHCILILGKRGTGKSYTLGVIAEAFGLLEKEYRDRISVLVVDTMGVFHSLKKANTNRAEVDRLREFQALSPRDFEDYARIFMPRTTIDRFKQDGQNIYYDGVLEIPIKDVDVYDWLTLFDVKPTDLVGILLVKVIDSLLSSASIFGFEEIYQEIDRQRSEEHVKESLRNMFGMIERLGVFGRTGTPYKKIVKGGQLSILDISYLGRIGGFDVRNLIITIIARRLLSERILYATLKMQSEANLIDVEISKEVAGEHPLVYLMIDEAHLFLPSNTRTLSSDILIDWIKLGRHPGLSLVLATQEPSTLHETAIRQADIIIAHNVTSYDDISALGKAKQSFMNGSKDIQKIVSTMEFKRGLAVIFDDKTRKIERCMIRPRLTLHTGVDASAMPDEQLNRHLSSISSEKETILTPRHDYKKLKNQDHMLEIKLPSG